MKSQSQEAFTGFLPTSCCFPLPGCFPPRIPRAARGAENQPAPPDRRPRSARRRRRCVPWPACQGLAGPAELGAQWPDHITGPALWLRLRQAAPTPSLFAEVPSFTCAGSRTVVTSGSRNCPQARAKTHESVSPWPSLTPLTLKIWPLNLASGSKEPQNLKTNTTRCRRRAHHRSPLHDSPGGLERRASHTGPGQQLPLSPFVFALALILL